MRSAVESDVSDLLQADKATMCDHALHHSTKGIDRCTQTTEQKSALLPSHARHHNT